MRGVRIFLYALVFIALMGLFFILARSYRPMLILRESAALEHTERGVFTIQGTLTNRGDSPVNDVELVAECVEGGAGFFSGERALEEYTKTQTLGRITSKEAKDFSIEIECPGERIVVRARAPK